MSNTATPIADCGELHVRIQDDATLVIRDADNVLVASMIIEPGPCGPGTGMYRVHIDCPDTSEVVHQIVPHITVAERIEAIDRILDERRARRREELRCPTRAHRIIVSGYSQRRSRLAWVDATRRREDQP